MTSHKCERIHARGMCVKCYKQWHYRRNKEKVLRQVRAVELRRKYGITPEQRAEMEHRQGGACALCGDKPKTPLVVDHDHNTGRVRGLLCQWCNRSFATRRSTATLIGRLVDYLSSDFDGRTLAPESR